MSRFLAPGSVLNEIWGSDERYPAHRVLIWNPNQTTISEVAIGTAKVAPLDISDFVSRVQVQENIGYESLSNPQVTRATFTFKHDEEGTGLNFRRGMIEDGVIVRVYEGDARVEQEGWLPTFTGTFRGSPGEDEGTRGTTTWGFSATAFGREERYLNRRGTTTKYPTQAAIDAAVKAGKSATIDIGVIAADIAKRHMNLSQDEVLFGAQGFISKHKVNQIVDLPLLQAVAECLWPVRKKPKFDELGRLKAVDVDFDKPPVRVYRDGDVVIRQKVRAPNDAEVANRVIISGLSDTISRVGPSNSRVLNDLQVTIGFFDPIYDEEIYFSDDRTLRATMSDAHAKTPITHPVNWAKLTWTHQASGPFKDRRGRLEINTVYLKGIYVTLFLIWLVTELLVASLDAAMDSGGETVANTVVTIAGVTLTIATWRLLLKGLALVVEVGVLWIMNHIGRGRYEVTGIPYEEVYQQIESRSQLQGLDEEEFRTVEYRNDFISDLTTLDIEAEARLRRELVKGQLFVIDMLPDGVLEVDDIIEVSPEPGLTKGDRYYIVTVSKTHERAPTNMQLIAWKIMDGRWSEEIEPLALVGAS